MNILFVCNGNNCRSHTAETIFAKLSPHHIRDAGVDAGSKVMVTDELLDWADIVFAMEEKHRKILVEKFPQVKSGSKLIVLDIPDRYRFMDEELILLLKTNIAPYIDTPRRQ